MCEAPRRADGEPANYAYWRQFRTTLVGELAELYRDPSLEAAKDPQVFARARKVERLMASGAPDKSPDVAGRRKRLVALCEALPGAIAEPAGAQHLAFKVGKKVFAYYAYDHHGDGRIALLSKAAPGEQGQLVGEDPERYFVPPYVGSRGWVGLRLDSSRVDWRAVKNLLSMAYVLTAPDKLRKHSGQGKAAKRGDPRRRPAKG
jgi:hypothetical protein